jgi:hypothetical protein
VSLKLARRADFIHKLREAAARAAELTHSVESVPSQLPVSAPQYLAEGVSGGQSRSYKYGILGGNSTRQPAGFQVLLQ